MFRKIFGEIMLITYSLPTYDMDEMKAYTDAYSKNISKYNRELLKIYSDINAGEVQSKDINTILSYGNLEENYDPLNFTYFIAVYFAKELKDRFDIPYNVSLNYSRLFAEGLYYFVHYNEDKETYDYLLDNISFNGGYTYKAKQLLDVYMREE